jgi:2-haloacid dehalogenase
MSTIKLRPKYITFDCYGTLTWFQMPETTRKVFADRVSAERMEDFVKDFSAFRFDEVLGPFKLYPDVVRNSLRRVCKLWNIAYRDSDGDTFVDAVPTWGPHADVPAGLTKLAKEYPLVILSNSTEKLIHFNVAKLGAPFAKVYTAEGAQAYKPRFQAFEYMFDQLGCAPADILHVSSSLRYDLIAAHDLRIGARVYVNRGYEPSTPAYGYHEIRDLGGLPPLLGL